MFNKKKAPRKQVIRIVLLDADGGERSACPAGEYVLPEPVVLALSVEYFNDPEPCAIHRGAVNKRAMMELLERCPAGHTVPLTSLSERLQSYFPADVAAVRIEENPG